MKVSLLVSALALLSSLSYAQEVKKLAWWEKAQLSAPAPENYPHFINCYRLVQNMQHTGLDRYVQIKISDANNIEYRYHNDARDYNERLSGPLEKVRKAKVIQMEPLFVRLANNTVEKRIYSVTFNDPHTDMDSNQEIEVRYDEKNKWRGNVRSQYEESVDEVYGVNKIGKARIKLAEKLEKGEITPEQYAEALKVLNETRLSITSSLMLRCDYKPDVKSWEAAKFSKKIYVR